MTALAAQQEIPLPREIASLGRPQRTHLIATSSMSLALILAGAFFLVMAGVFVLIYFKATFKKDDPVPKETMLYIAGGVGLLGFGLGVGGWCKGGFGKDAKGGGAYLFYPEALAVLQDDSITLVRWDEVTELLSPQGWGDYRIATQDGRTVTIQRNVQDYSGLIAAVVSRAAQEIAEPARRALEAGETVTFGPFEINQEVIAYKGKTLPWEHVAALEIQIGQAGRRLRIRATGSIFPWCYADLDSFPNGALFPNVLRTVCPRRLLVDPSKRRGLFD